MACIVQHCISCGAKRFTEVDVRRQPAMWSFVCSLCQTRYLSVTLESETVQQTDTVVQLSEVHLSEVVEVVEIGAS